MREIYRSLLLLLCVCFLLPARAQKSFLVTDSPKRESRTVWLTTLYGLDWPKTKAVDAAGRQQQQQELIAILDSLKHIHINTVLFQTRVRGTLVYPSEIEPWDACLTGQTGKDPGYDPLAFAIKACHDRGMELHAWLVSIPCFKVSAARSMGKQSILKRHPELLRKYHDTWYLDPGMPGTADYLADICREITMRYDIDGIHLDYIRYPENAPQFPDQATYRRYGRKQDKKSWRRQNITHCVATIYHTIKTLKPWVKLSSSPIGKYKDLSRYSAAGWNAYDAVHQDAQGWLRQGIHDMLFPMMYFKGNHFYPFAADWQESAAQRPVVPGLGIYFLSPKEKDWPLEDIERELQFIRREGLGGQAYFRTAFLLEDVKGLYRYLKNSYYTNPALTPVCNSHDSLPPSVPERLQLTGTPYQAKLTWNRSRDHLNGTDVRYNIYMSQNYPVDITQAGNLIATYLCDTTWTFNPMYAALYGFHFAVTAIDRSGNESRAAMLDPTHSPDNRKPARICFGMIRLSQEKQAIILPEITAEFVTILDMQGRMVRTVPYRNSVDISGLDKGIYEVRTLGQKGFSRQLGYFMKTF